MTAAGDNDPARAQLPHRQIVERSTADGGSDDILIRFRTFTAGLKMTKGAGAGSFLADRNPVELGKMNLGGRTKYRVRASIANDTTAGFFFISRHQISLRRTRPSGEAEYRISASCKAKSGPFRVKGEHKAQMKEEFAPRIEYALLFEKDERELRIPLRFDSWSSSQEAVLTFEDYFVEKDYSVEQTLSPMELVIPSDGQRPTIQVTLSDLKAVQWGFAERENLPNGRAYEFVPKADRGIAT